MKFLSDILAKAGLVVDGTVTLNSVANATTDTDRFIVVDSGVVKYRTGAQILSDIGGISGNQTITISGDATGSGTTSIALTLANSGVTAGTYGSASAVPVITVDAKGRVTGVTTASISGSLTFTGDVTGSGTTGTTTTLTLANSGVVAGTYNNVTVNAKGLVTSGSNVSYLTSYTETDTLATVTARGATTSTVVTFSGGDGNNSSIKLAGYNQRGGVGFHGFLEVTSTYSSGTNSNKYFRIDSVGSFQIINSAYTLSIFNLTNAGDFSVPGSATANSFIKSGGTSSQFLKADGSVDSSTYATQTYVGTQIANLVASAPAALDTLNELAAALGNDPNFATTITTALGNRLRIDINTQGLTATQQGNGRTNLGLGTLATLSSVGNAQITDVAWSKVTGAPAFITGNQTITLSGDATGSGATAITVTLANSGVTAGTYTKVTVDAKGRVTSGTTLASGDLPTYTGTLTSSQVTTALGYTPYNSTNPNGYITSSALSPYLLLAGGSMTGNISFGSSGAGLTWAANTDGASITFESTGDGASGGRALSNLLIALTDNGDEGLKVTTTGSELLYVNINQFQYKGSNVWTAANLTNLNQLTNGPGYITSYSETDTLATVTGRGATTSTAVIMTGGSGTTPTLTLDRNIATPSNYYTGLQLEVRATSGTAGIGLHRNGFSHVGIYHDSANELKFNMNAGTVIVPAGAGTLWGSGNLTNLNQLTNGPGYITGYTETDTLASVTGRGASTTAGISVGSVTGSITSSGSGDSNAPFRFAADYSGWMTIVAGTPGSNNGWGLFWAGNSGAQYGTNGTGGPGDIWSNSDNPNEYVFVGNGQTNMAIHGNTGNVWIAGTLRVAGTITGTLSGNASTASALTSMNISQFTNNSGYITSSGSISGSAGSATQVVTLQDNPPSGVNGQLWFETDTLRLKVYSSASSAWIDSFPMPDMSLYYTRAGGAITGSVVMQQDLTVNGQISADGILKMNTTGTSYIRMGRFPQSLSNAGEAWIGRAADRSTGTMTVQLGGSSNGSFFEIVDHGWTTVTFKAGMNDFSYKGNNIWHAGNLTNLNQLTNGPGYITGYTETDTLASVTGRGASTNTAVTINNALVVSGNVPNLLTVLNNAATNYTTAYIAQTVQGGNGNQNIGLLVDVQGAGSTDRIANFRYYNSGSPVSVLAVTRGQKVGINNQAPDYDLDVTGSIHATGDYYQNSKLGILTQKKTSAAVNFNTQSVIIANLGGYDDARRHAGIIKISVSNGPSGSHLGSATYLISPNFNLRLTTGWILRCLDATYFSAQNSLGHILKLYSAAYTNAEDIYLVYEGNLLTGSENSYYVTVEWTGIQPDKALSMEVITKASDSRVTGAGAARVVTATDRYDDRYVSLSGSYSNPTWITSLAWSKITGAPSFITGNQTITVSGDATGSGTTSIALTLANSGVSAGTYTKVTVDAKGRVTSGTTLSAGDIPTLNQNTTGSAGSLSSDGDYLRTRGAGSEANLDTYTDNGVRTVSFTGHSQHLLSWNLGGSTGTVQQLFHYGTAANGWRIRNKTDNSSWSSWGYVVMTTANQGHISGTIWHSGNLTNLNQLTNGPGYITGNQTITLSGDVSGSGTTSISVTVNQIDGWSFVNTGSNSGTAADSINSNGISYVSSNISLLGQTDGALYSQAYSSSWQHQIYGDYRTGQIVLRGKNNGTWQSWRTVLDSSNYTSYSPSLTGSGASGTWGINITGSAGSAGSATSATQVVTIQDNPPSGSNGRLWWESDTGKLKVYYGSSSAWVDATPIPDMSLYYPKAGGVITGDVTVSQTLNVIGNTLIQGTLTETSDISLKENILPLKSSLEKVMKLNGVSFNKKVTPEVKEIGFIAQEVEAIIPDLVTETGEGVKTVSYSRVTAVLVETIKEQQTQINELKNLVNSLIDKFNNF